MEQEGVAMRFWNKFKNKSAFVIYSPFIVSLASEKLNLRTFQSFIAQDFYFLGTFARAYEMAEERTDDNDEKCAISELRNSVMLTLLRIRDSLVQECGLDSMDDSGTSASENYKDFLLEIASGTSTAVPLDKTKISAYTLSALTPHMRLHSFLSKTLRALVVPTESNHLYKKWTDSYSSESFEAATLETEDLLDNLCISLTTEELEIVEKIYHHAMKLEMNTFCAQISFPKTVVPLYGRHNQGNRNLIIFSDFDLTCSAVDSSAILAEIAILTEPKADLRNIWDALTIQYTEEYEQCINSIISGEKVEEFDFEGLFKALEKLSELDKRANSRVFNSGLLRGLNLEDIKRAGERLMLQDGCIEFFQRIIENEGAAHILSYCWCGDLIRSAFSSGGLNVLNLHTNELTYEGSISTGEIVKKVESLIDKVQVLRGVEKNDGEYLSVYIGDSVSDLLCLLEADVGIVIGSDSNLKKVGNEFGVSFVPLFSGVVKRQREHVKAGSYNWKGGFGSLYTVSNWAEIHAFLLGRSLQEILDRRF